MPGQTAEQFLQFAAYRCAMLQYHPLQAESLAISSLPAQHFIAGYEHSRPPTREIRLLVFARADGLTSAQYGAVMAELEVVVRRFGEEGIAHFQQGGNATHVQVGVCWVFESAVLREGLQAATQLSRTVRGSTMGHWPIDVLALSVATSERSLVPLLKRRRLQPLLNVLDVWTQDAGLKTGLSSGPQGVQAFRQAEAAIRSQLFSGQTPATITLLALIASFFVFGQLLPGKRMSNDVLALGELLPWHDLHGEWWRLVSAGFLHASITHVALNGASLWFIGQLCERAYGWLRFSGIYVVALIVGNLASAVLVPQPAVGASGAIFGLLGALMATLWLHRQSVSSSVTQSLLRWAVTITVLNVGFGLVTPSVDMVAHVAGFASGAAAALVVRPLPPLGKAAQGFTAGVVSVGLIAVASVAMLQAVAMVALALIGG